MSSFCVFRAAHALFCLHNYTDRRNGCQSDSISPFAHNRGIFAAVFGQNLRQSFTFTAKHFAAGLPAKKTRGVRRRSFRKFTDYHG
jgi:hypothetical protein